MSKHILVIEPSRVIRKILEVHLQLAGHTLKTFATYGQASGVLPFFQYQPPDLIFLALHPSQAESCSLLQLLRLHYLDAVLVAMIDQEEQTQRTVQAVVRETCAVALVKPFRIQDVLALSGRGQPPDERMRIVV